MYNKSRKCKMINAEFVNKKRRHKKAKRLRKFEAKVESKANLFLSKLTNLPESRSVAMQKALQFLRS